MTRNMSVIQGSGDDHGHGGRFAFGPSKTPNLSASYRGSLLSNSFLPSTSSSRSTTTTLNASTISEDVVDIEYFSGYSTITTMGMHSTYGSSSSATYDYDEEVGEVAEDRSNEIYLTRLLYSIDLFVFDDFTRPPDRDDQVIEIPNNLLTECHVWRDKFRRKRGARPKWSTESMVLANNNNSNSSRQRAPSSYSLLASTLHPTILPQLPSSPHDQPTSLQLNLVFPQLPSVSNESRSLQHGNSFSKYAPTKPPDLPISAWTRPQREPSSGRRVTLPPLVNRFAQSANKSNAAESRPPMTQIRDLGNEDSWFIRALAVPADTSRPQCPMSFNWPNVQSEESRSVLPSSKATSIVNNTRRRRLRWSRDDSLTSMSSFTSASSSVIRNRYHSLVGDRVDLSFEEDEFEENPKTALHLPSIES